MQKKRKRKNPEAQTLKFKHDKISLKKRCIFFYNGFRYLTSIPNVTTSKTRESNFNANGNDKIFV